MLLTFTDGEPLGGRLASRLSCAAGSVEVHHFPDGESRIRLPPALPERVILCRSLDDPNAKLVELMLAAQCARELGARHVTLVAPYLCYMRQDTAFASGEAVSQRIVGDFLARYFDGLVTVDPHLHRTTRLEDAVPATTSRAVSAAPFIGDFLTSRGRTALLLGPDAESRQWVSAVAARADLEFAIAEKTRRGDRDVTITLPARDWTGVEVVLVDDVAASGRTLAEAARALKAAGAGRVDAVVTHALFAGDALAVMHSAGIDDVWTSDSIGHATNAFSLAGAIAAAL